jgi:hypothetical protein
VGNRKGRRSGVVEISGGEPHPGVLYYLCILFYIWKAASLKKIMRGRNEGVNGVGFLPPFSTALALEENQLMYYYS